MYIYEIDRCYMCIRDIRDKMRLSSSRHKLIPTNLCMFGRLERWIGICTIAPSKIMHNKFWWLYVSWSSIRRLLPSRETCLYLCISSIIGTKVDRCFVLVSVNGSIPLKRIYNSSLAYPGEGRISPISLMF